MKNFMFLFMVGLSFNGFSQQNPSTDNHSGSSVTTLAQPTGKNTVLVKNYDENGRLLETGTRKDGLKDKSWVSYNSNGSIVTIGNFSNGLRDGVWLIFDENGKVKYEVTYEKNRVINAFDWNESLASTKIEK